MVDDGDADTAISAAAIAALRDISRDYEIPSLFAVDDCLRVFDECERPPHEWLLVGPRRSGSPVHTGNKTMIIKFFGK